MISLFKKQNIIKPLVSVLLVLSIILVAYGPTEKTPRAEAIPVTGFVTTTEVGGPMLPAVLATAVSSGDTAFNTGSLAVAWITKESGIGGAFSLDAIAWFAINLIIHQLAQEIISWINSGFQGSPAFMSDLEGFLRGVADRVAGEFIYGSELGFLCSPFRLNVQLALAIQYGKGRNFETRCTLSDAVGNVNNFINGDFLAGGWNGWYSMTQDPRNNPHGALLLAQEQLSVRLSGTKGNELKLLDFSKGFFNVRQCQPDDSDAPGHCTTVTPGSAIENQLNSALEMPTNRLMVADEINEILSALFSQLVSTVFNGAGGLLGLTNSSYGSGNYFSLLASSTAIVGATGTAPIYTPPGGGGGGGGGPGGGNTLSCGPSADPLQYTGAVSYWDNPDYNWGGWAHDFQLSTPSTFNGCTFGGVNYPLSPSGIITHFALRQSGLWYTLDPLSTGDVGWFRQYGATTVFRLRTPASGNLISLNFGNGWVALQQMYVSLSKNPCDFGTGNVLGPQSGTIGLGSVGNNIPVVTNAAAGQLEPNQIYYFTILDTDTNRPEPFVIDIGNRLSISPRINTDSNPPPPNNLSCVSTAPPPPPAPPIVVTPTTYTSAACTGQSFNFAISGGRPAYYLSSTGLFVATPPPPLLSGGTAISGLATGSGLHTFTFRDISSPALQTTATINCQ
jgi:hypothetical protein